MVVVLFMLVGVGCAADDQSSDPVDSLDSSAPQATDPPIGPETIEMDARPSTGVVAGDAVIATADGVEPGTDFVCVLSVIKADGSATASDLTTLKTVTSTADGELTCSQDFEPFEAADEGGALRSCPVRPKDAAEGFTCAVAVADAASMGVLFVGAGIFTAEEP